MQGPPCLSVQSNLALTDRNMHAKIFLKVVLKSWDYEFFGTTTHFCEMLTVRPLLDSMLVTFSFKNKFSIFDYFLFKFCSFFFWFWAYMTQEILGMTTGFIESLYCWFCCNSISFWNTSEKWFFKLFPIPFKRVAKSWKVTVKNKHNVVIIKKSVIPSKYLFI